MCVVMTTSQWPFVMLMVSMCSNHNPGTMQAHSEKEYETIATTDNVYDTANISIPATASHETGYEAITTTDTGYEAITRMWITMQAPREIEQTHSSLLYQKRLAISCSQVILNCHNQYEWCSPPTIMGSRYYGLTVLLYVMHVWKTWKTTNHCTVWQYYISYYIASIIL